MPVQHFELGFLARFLDGQTDEAAEQVNKSLLRGFFACHALNAVKWLWLLEVVPGCVFSPPTMTVAGRARFHNDHTDC